MLLRICSGNAFHNLGAAYINALSLRVVYDFAGGSVRSRQLLILSCNYHSPLLLKVLSDKQALVDEVI